MAPMMPKRLILYSRLGCHLCERMQTELNELAAELPFDLTVEDVDQRSDWRNAYSNDIPVLTVAGGQELCRHHLDEPAVRDYLRSAG